jgi:hypothetical protein
MILFQPQSATTDYGAEPFSYASNVCACASTTPLISSCLQHINIHPQQCRGPHLKHMQVNRQGQQVVHRLRAPCQDSNPALAPLAHTALQCEPQFYWHGPQQ